MRLLLVHPPIFDFTASDFWLRPYGMMRVASQMRHICRFVYFDYLRTVKKDAWGRGRFAEEIIPKPAAFSDIPRRFRRFGRPRGEFRELLRTQAFDAVLVQTSMTYWYQGVREVIEDIRELQPFAKIVLGGVYATLCPEHAESAGADLVIRGSNLEPLWRMLSTQPINGDPYFPEENDDVGVLKLSDGCPFNCTYCAAPRMWDGFASRDTVACLRELRLMVASGVKNIAFYDDALLYRAEEVLIPFLKSVISERISVRFHTPNALNARFLTPELARLMVQAGFAGFFFGLESGMDAWQAATGGKVKAVEFAAAVRYLREAGARYITAYIITGHPDSETQSLEESIKFAHDCGVKIMLSDFSPIPGTEDGKKSARWADMKEPLSHNKTAFAFRRLGADHLNRIKRLTHTLNDRLLQGDTGAADHGWRQKG